MGLDMYIYKAKKPMLVENTVYEEAEMNKAGFMLLSEDEMNTPAFEALKSFAVKVNIMMQELNKEKIRADFDMGENMYESMFCGDNVTFRDGDKQCTISTKELKEKYMQSVDRMLYAVELTQIAYWRKEYDLQSQIYEAFEEQDIYVENCGFYALDDEIAKMICEHDEMQAPAIQDEDVETLFYHEWY